MKFLKLKFSCFREKLNSMAICNLHGFVGKTLTTENSEHQQEHKFQFSFRTGVVYKAVLSGVTRSGAALAIINI